MLCIAALFAVYVGVSKCHAYLLYREMRQHMKVYVFDDHYKSLNAAPYISSLSDSAGLKRYYELEKSGVDTALPGEVQYVPVFNPVYVVGYFGSDSGMVGFIDIDTCCWGYVRGYAYSGTVHAKPAADSLLDRLRQSNEQYQMEHPAGAYGRPSPYGIYCDCK